MSYDQFKARSNAGEFQKQLEPLHQKISDFIRGKPALLHDLERARGALDVIEALMRYADTELPKWMLDAHTAYVKAALIEARSGQDAKSDAHAKEVCRLLARRLS